MKPFQLPRWKFSSCCGHECGYDSAHEGSRAGATRRDFIKGAAASVAGLAAVAALPVEAVAQGRTYPPPPPATSPVDGLIDFHVHTAPDVFGRALTDDEEAQLSKDRGMEAVVLKSHTALTADRAWIARRRVLGMKIFGGITLNGSAGGINVDAVRWMWRMQGGYGRVVWFPTFDANNHVTRLREAPSGIKVVGDDGTVLPAVREKSFQQAALVQHLDAAYVQPERPGRPGHLGPPLQHHGLHAVQPQLGRQHQSGRSAADHDHVDHRVPRRSAR